MNKDMTHNHRQMWLRTSQMLPGWLKHTCSCSCYFLSPVQAAALKALEQCVHQITSVSIITMDSLGQYLTIKRRENGSPKVSKGKICVCLCSNSLWLDQFVVISNFCSSDTLNLPVEYLSLSDSGLLVPFLKLKLTPAAILCWKFT